MISPEGIKNKAARKYASFLRSCIEQKPFEKLIIRGDKNYTKSSLAEFEKEIQLIISQCKESKGFGYTLVFQQVRTKYLGTQDLPISISFDTENDFLNYLGKKHEVALFRDNVAETIRQFPELRGWLLKKPIKVVQHQNVWDSILKVCCYFKHNPKPNLYIRALPIKVHTKFIEKNQGLLKELLDLLIPEDINEGEKQFEERFNLKYAEYHIRFKILDSELSSKYFSGVDDLAVPLSQFEELDLPVERVIVLENKTTFYTALTLPNVKKSIALFGSGFSVSNLKAVPWFKDKELLYWGDIDVQGFEILSQFRGYFPNTKSILMDRQTFDDFFENDTGTPTKNARPLNLSKEEQELYDILKRNNWRLEQEKVPFNYVNQYFRIKLDNN